MKKALLVLFVLALGSCAVLQMGRQPEPFAEGSESLRRLAPGPFEVVTHEETFIDTSRPTRANGDYPGDDKRTLAGRVWFPADRSAAPYPLVVYSHGFTSNHLGGKYIAEHLASLGHVVVAVDYPLTSMGAPGGPVARDVVNQPGDVSFLIDTLIAQSDTPNHPLAGLVDSTRIGVTGISLGGLTTTLAAFHPDSRDPRIRAALSIAGPTSPFTPTFFSFASVPFLMLAGDIDALVPYASNAAPVPDRVAGSELVTLRGASHTGFADPAVPMRWLNNPDAIGCYMVKDRVDREMDEPWFEQLGTPEQGIDYNAENELCLVEPLPEAMNVLRQHMITRVVVGSFFQARFAPEPAQRAAARRFLSEVLAAELADVEYRRADSGRAGVQPRA